MMAVAEATSSTGSVLGAFFTASRAPFEQTLEAIDRMLPVARHA